MNAALLPEALPPVICRPLLVSAIAPPVSWLKVMPPVAATVSEVVPRHVAELALPAVAATLTTPRSRSEGQLVAVPVKLPPALTLPKLAAPPAWNATLPVAVTAVTLTGRPR